MAFYHYTIVSARYERVTYKPRKGEQLHIALNNLFGPFKEGGMGKNERYFQRLVITQVTVPLLIVFLKSLPVIAGNDDQGVGKQVFGF